MTVNFDSPEIRVQHSNELFERDEARESLKRLQSELEKPNVHLNTVINNGFVSPDSHDAYNLRLARDLNTIREYVAGAHLDPGNMTHRSNVVSDLMNLDTEDSFYGIIRIVESLNFARMEHTAKSIERGDSDIKTFTDIPIPGVYEGSAAIRITSSTDTDGALVQFSIVCPQSDNLQPNQVVDLHMFKQRLKMITSSR